MPGTGWKSGICLGDLRIWSLQAIIAHIFYFDKGDFAKNTGLQLGNEHGILVMILRRRLMHLLEAYLHEMALIHTSGAGVDELSYYPPLAELLGEVGKQLKPRCTLCQPAKELRRRHP